MKHLILIINHKCLSVIYFGEDKTFPCGKFPLRYCDNIKMKNHLENCRLRLKNGYEKIQPAFL